MKRLILPVVLGLLLIGVVVLGALPQPSQGQSTARLVTVLSSASRITDTASSDVYNLAENLNTRGAYLVLDVTAIASSPRITLSVQVKDSLSGKYQSVMTATTGVTAVGTKTYLVYPGAGTAAADITQVAGFPLPPVWRVYMDHDDGDAITYTVGAMLLP